MRSYLPSELSAHQRHDYLLSTIGPRPIAWVSTINEDGIVNLAPFSFFNIFGSNPVTLIFSPARRVKDNSTKHTLQNSGNIKECVVNIVSYDLVGQMVLSSTEYPDGVDEFSKIGLTAEPSDLVKPPRVKEAPAQYECVVKQIIHTGEEGGAGNLIICEVLKMHFREDIFTEDDKIDPLKVDTVARMGGLWYTRAKEGLFQIHNPKGHNNIGFEGIPEFIRNSEIYTANNLSELAKYEALPTVEEVNEFIVSDYFKGRTQHWHLKYKIAENWSQHLITEGKVKEAWCFILAAMKDN
ncbi:MAG: flavin reductase family protein [Bacteroidetes bacterium]|nr:flavin reductase family protein [Bacteroidota bacterium]